MRKVRKSITAKYRFSNLAPVRCALLETARCARTVSHENTHDAAHFNVNLHAVIDFQ